MRLTETVIRPMLNRVLPETKGRELEETAAAAR